MGQALLLVVIELICNTVYRLSVTHVTLGLTNQTRKLATGLNNSLV